MATTRFRDPATGRFIRAEAAARLSVPTASAAVTEPSPAPKKDKKKLEKKQGKKHLKKNGKKAAAKKKAGSSRKKAKKKGRLT